MGWMTRLFGATDRKPTPGIFVWRVQCPKCSAVIDNPRIVYTVTPAPGGDWVLCSDRLPAMGYFVLCFDGREVDIRCRRIHGDDWEWNDDHEPPVPKDQITHWMAIPSKPKE